MSSYSKLIARGCENLVEPIRQAQRALESVVAGELDAEARTHCESAMRANSEVLSLLVASADLRQSEAEGFALAPQPRRLRDLMDEVEGRWTAGAEAADVCLTISYDGDPDCEVMVDWARLSQVMDALLARALASAAQGVVEASLATRVCDGGVLVTCRVRDDGEWTGAADVQPWLQDAVAENGESAAHILRLALASKIVAAMGGTLELRANVGRGATLAFEVTCQAPSPADHIRDTVAAGRAAHILVVDDNATNRMVVEALCEMFDCSSEAVADGVEAVEAARVGRFDVILMDIKMPRMDGLTATAEIRKLPGAAGRPPIIALTANAGPDDVQAYLAAGMCAVVEKPIKAERLLEALEDALATARPAGAAAAAA